MSTEPPLSLPESLAGMLDRVRRRKLGLKVAEFPLLLLSGLVVIWVLQALVDREMELSRGVRTVLLALQGIGVLALLHALVVRPLLGRLNRRHAALLVENAFPRFRSSLISAYDLTASPEACNPRSRALVGQLLDEVSSEVEKEDIARSLFGIDRLRRLAIFAAALLGFGLVLFLVFQPVSGILIQRIFLSDVALPAETRVIAMTGDLKVNPGETVALQARAEGVIPASGTLRVRYDDGVTESVEVFPSDKDPALFAHTVPSVRASFDYHFEIHDGSSEAHRVTAVVLPTLEEVRFTQIYPDYTGLPETPMPPSSLRLLAGSVLRIEATASIGLESSGLLIRGREEEETISRDLDIVGEKSNRLRAEMTVPEEGWRSLSIHLTSRDSISSRNDPVYPVEIRADQPPRVALVEPGEDRTTLLARETPRLAFRARDDYGIARLALCYRVIRPGLREDSGSETGRIPLDLREGAKSHSGTLEWNLNALLPPLVPGCRLSYWVEAEDHNDLTGPGIGRSLEKQIEIVSEARKRLELLELLGERARAIEELYRMQREANERIDESIR